MGASINGKMHIPSHVTLCVKCRHVFMMIGSVPIRLGEWRQPERGINEQVRQGVCPVHRQIADVSYVMK